VKFPASFDRLACVIAVLAFAGLGGFLALNSALNADEGFYLLASRLVSEGFQPGVDFGYTQGPVLPYANVPWLALFGYNLEGLRLAGLAWGLIAVITGVIALRGRNNWATAASFVVLLLGAPVWLDFVAKGKTYAFTELMVLIGAVALTARWPVWLRWTCLIAAAALGTGARYPTAGFFAPAWLALLLLTPGWRQRIYALAATLACAAGLLWLAGAANWERFFYWTAGFHTQSTFAFSRPGQLRYFLMFAPAVWLAVVWSAAHFRDETERAPMLALGALVLGLVANLTGQTTYAEYVFPFVPAAAFLAAPAAEQFFSRVPVPVRLLVVLAALAGGWIHPPEFDRGLLSDANEAAVFLQGHVPPGAMVAASMPEIPVAAGERVPLTMAMGKYAITEELSPARAAQLGMLSPVALVEILHDPATKALVISPVLNWNFFWSLPSYRWLSEKSRHDIREAVRQDYLLGYTNNNYVIFLRKP
jgi:hypothetical protein